MRRDGLADDIDSLWLERILILLGLYQTFAGEIMRIHATPVASLRPATMIPCSESTG